MVLADDNFATIVAAVERGRAIYANLMKYIRVQMIMLAGFILTLRRRRHLRHRQRPPRSLPLQILWINFVVDVLLALGLGFDAPTPWGSCVDVLALPDQPVIVPRSALASASPACWWPSAPASVVSWAEGRDGLAVATTMGLVDDVASPSPPHSSWGSRPLSERLQPQHDRERALQHADAHRSALTLLVTTIPAPPAHLRHRRPDGRPVACLPDRGRRLLRARRAGQAAILRRFTHTAP